MRSKLDLGTMLGLNLTASETKAPLVSMKGKKIEVKAATGVPRSRRETYNPPN